jgi:Zn-dependent M28 family amino/carboxypeptidase
LINVMGSYAPDRARRIMLAAHYDSRPWADQEPDSTLWTRPIPAAVDGAAGVAVLLELARVIGTRLPPDVGVDIVLFDGEDYGKEGDIEYYLLGSQGFIARAAGYRPACMILLDMVGGRGTRVQPEGFSRQRSPRLVDFIFGRARELGLSYFATEDGAPMYDDHVPFLQAGWDAIDLFGYGFEAWHTLRDDLGQVDRGMLGQVGTLLQSVVYDFRYPPRTP